MAEFIKTFNEIYEEKKKLKNKPEYLKNLEKLLNIEKRLNKNLNN